MIYQKVVSRFVNDSLSSSLVFSVLFANLMFISIANADEVSILNVESHCRDNICSFDVTLEHDDSGWDHYADLWQILSDDGTVLGKRVLLHPHVNEQPFTRSLNGVNIPNGINTVWIEAHDSVHGMSADKFKVDL